MGDVGRSRRPRTGGRGRSPAPNIVFVLTDDLSGNLVPYMPHVLRWSTAGHLQQLLRDRLPLLPVARVDPDRPLSPQHAVFDNSPPDGGYRRLLARGEQARLRPQPAATPATKPALMGKYLNGYSPGYLRAPYWDDWEVQGSLGYSEYGYSTNSNGTLVRRTGYEPDYYLTTVLQRRALRFIDSASAPFALEVSTFLPHEAVRTESNGPDIRDGYAVPAPEDDKPFQRLHGRYRVPRGASYNVKNKNAPDWLDTRRLYPHAKAILDARYCKRAQAVKSVDRMVGALRAELEAKGLADNTYFVFNSDNGFHTGQHRLGAGKMTAFEEDIRVPLVVAGPGSSPAGRSAR